MAKRICVECGETIHAGEARVRSVNFVQVFRCGSCDGVAAGLALVASLPSQRSGSHDARVVR